MGASPDGTTVFVTGTSPAKGFRYGYATVAYNATTGAPRWVARYREPGNDYASAIAVSRDGSKVFVAGSVSSSHSGYSTVAYDQATGDQRWVARSESPSNRDAFATGLALNPTGTRVSVTGWWDRSSRDYATVSYKATGSRVWTRRYGSPGGNDVAQAIAATGSRVFVTGTSQSGSAKNAWATLAYGQR
jgi:hypothetical protein